MKNLHLKYKLDWRDKTFLRTFPRKIAALRADEKKAIDEKFVQIFNNEEEHITDRPGQSHILMCAYILAAYRVLNEKGNDPEGIIKKLTAAFKSSGGIYIKLYMRIMLRLKRDKRKFIEESTIESIKAYGDSFEITTKKEDRRFISIVRKCGYYDFFQRHGRPELTKIFCEWDSLWSDEINRFRCGIRFDRPKTIANQDKECLFEFQYDSE